MRALLLAALLTGADGGLSDLYITCPAAPPAVRVDGGWLITDARDVRLGCMKAACENAALQALGNPPVVEPPKADGLFVVVLVGVAVALFGGGMLVSNQYWPTK